jgi:hypothetical protein
MPAPAAELEAAASRLALEEPANPQAKLAATPALAEQVVDQQRTAQVRAQVALDPRVAMATAC